MKAAILASGPSLFDEDIEYVKALRESGKIDYVIAVSDVGLLKAPWADALCSHDSRWWSVKNAETKFTGRKFSASGYGRTEKYDVRSLGVAGGMNSGLFAMFVARDIFKCCEMYLLGFDLHRRNGQHFFGDHTEVYNNKLLKNTDERLFQKHIGQFDRFSGAQVYNCTKGSDLKRFTFAELRDILPL